MGMGFVLQYKDHIWDVYVTGKDDSSCSDSGLVDAFNATQYPLGLLHSYFDLAPSY